MYVTIGWSQEVPTTGDNLNLRVVVFYDHSPGRLRIVDLTGRQYDERTFFSMSGIGPSR